MPLKRWHRAHRRRLAEAPPRIRTGHPLRDWALRLLVALLLLAAGGYGGYRYAQPPLVGPQQAAVSSQASAVRGASLEAELAAVLAREALLNQKLRIGDAERAAQANELAGLRGQLSVQQEALAFFQSLLQTNDRSRPVSVAVCSVVPEAGNRVRYRLLLVQGINRDAEFKGRLLVSMQYRQDGKLAAQSAPDEAISFRHYGNREGVLTLPAGARAQLFEARVVGDNNNVLASCQQKQGD